MDFLLKNKIALVTASTKGLGKAVVIELLQEGAKVVACGRNATGVKALRAELEPQWRDSVKVLQADVAVADDRRRLLEETARAFGGLDILVTNTGGPPTGLFAEHTQAAWDNAYQLLLGSVVGLIREALPHIKGAGRILTITSQAIRQPVDGLILSNSVRLSIAGLVKTLASELGPRGITVNNVMPGYTGTERLTTLMEKNRSLFQMDEIPLRRIATPEEFAAAVVFLASERASYITGVSLPVDGGWVRSVL